MCVKVSVVGGKEVIENWEGGVATNVSIVLCTFSSNQRWDRTKNKKNWTVMYSTLVAGEKVCHAQGNILYVTDYHAVNPVNVPVHEPVKRRQCT